MDDAFLRPSAPRGNVYPVWSRGGLTTVEGRGVGAGYTWVGRIADGAQANNRMHSSAALRTTDMWSSVIGDEFGKANDAAQVVLKPSLCLVGGPRLARPSRGAETLNPEP